ncbi:MAG: tryptophan 7-halogenase [Thermogemmatispora sp.]|uniref:NAD(P)/FAD-dependent oxidoreductase n=1 Tax=Thermogemmatispora sp. TaxID=1968838 RepID=UPI001A069230|nr:NAD(P)/FAD-dependent oxidoreductase [Thermogemmatispora sp.]MBE3565961.1 tryptophan 7-halogenase [Thermogemmatispora sp.]
MTRRYDVIIIGGGPAGSTVAALTRRYAPQLRLLLLEKEAFPRHHVGESLLAGASPVLEEMGAYEQVANAGFLEKLGATFILGQSREPWGFEFDELISQLVAQGKRLPRLYTRAWQVRRAEYDELLLRHAASLGVEVRQRARVTRVLWDREPLAPLPAEGQDGREPRALGVEFVDERGPQTVFCDWVLDCSGQQALLGHALKLREYDGQMNNYALFAYWQGAKWLYEYTGYPELTRICIITTPRGWIWYIPLRRDVMSVGFVTHRQTLKQLPAGPEQLYLEELQTCAEVRDLLKEAHLTRIAADQRRLVCAIQDWSYRSRQISGRGWAMVGDAAGFVDPILSSGVMLAHELGQKAAYTLVSSFAAGSDEEVRRYWEFYAQTYRTYLQAYRDMAAFWYSNNFSLESWFWQARRILARSGSELNLSDRQAFTRLASGYATRAESLSLFGSYPLHEAQQLVNGLFGAPYSREELVAQYAGRPLRLKEAELCDGLYYYQGAVRQTRRVLNRQTGRYLDLHPGEEVLLSLFDGAHTLAHLEETAKALQALPQTERLPLRSGLELLVQLEMIGVLA